MAKVQFRVHPKFIYDAIRRQAGTLCKAVLEGTMNAVESGSKAVHITFEQSGDKARLCINDTGGGIITEQEIVRHFATFGQPHAADEQKIWAQFRMGRGQLFSFGVNTWLTGTHKLIVDIEQWNVEDVGDDWNLDFDWIEGQKLVKGCQIVIDLYKNPIRFGYPSEAAFQDAIRRQVEFIAVPVYFNGTQLNHDPRELDWDLEDDDAYYLWAQGSNLTVYNLGAFCKEIPASTAGVTGVIVSKQQLRVNFARNDIQYDCPVWRRIHKVVQKNKIARTRSASRGNLQRHERISTLQDVRDGIQTYGDWKNISLLETTSGRAITLDFMRKNCAPWTFATRDDAIADKLMQLERAICLNDEVVSELGYSGDPRYFFTWLLGDRFKTTEKWFRPFKGQDGLSDEFNSETHIVASLKWNPAERRIIKVLMKIGDWFNLWQDRDLCMGVSDVYAAWTDGSTFIAMDRKWLKRVSTGSEAATTKLFAVLTHEMAHDEDSARTHLHGEEFYRRYHDLTHGQARDEDGKKRTSPLVGINYFRSEIRDARIEEQYAKTAEKDKREQERRQKKLGIGKRVAASSDGGGCEPARAKRKNVKRRPRGIRKLRL